MKDATLLLNSYRECARGLWNNFLRPRAEPYVSFDAVDAFSGICAALFAELVLRPLGKSGFTKTSADEVYPFLLLKPLVDPFPLMVARPSTSGKYWDDPVDSLGLVGVSLLFIDYFDWDRFGYIDMQYYRAKISSCNEHPHLVGREVLLDVHHARVDFEDPRQRG